jgi:trk system potassium uptake protein TrkA
VAFLIRFGTGVLPEKKTVIQSGDQVYLAAVSGSAAEAQAIAGQSPAEGVGE